MLQFLVKRLDRAMFFVSLSYSILFFSIRLSLENLELWDAIFGKMIGCRCFPFLRVFYSFLSFLFYRWGMVGFTILGKISVRLDDYRSFLDRFE